MLLISLCAFAVFSILHYATRKKTIVQCGTTGFDWEWKKQIPNKIFIWVLLVLVLTSTVRHGFIDTYAYKEMYIASRNDLEYVASAPYGVEEGWLRLCYMLNFISADPKLLLFVSALIINFAYISSIKKYSCDPVFSILIFFCLTYLDTNNGLRQMVAAGIIMLAYPLLLREKKRWRYYLLFVIMVALAYQFHVSAVVAILIAFVAKGKPFNLRVKLALLLGVVFLFAPGAIGEYIGEIFADSKYINYLEFSGGMTLPRAFVVGIFPCLLAILYIKRCKKNNVVIDKKEAFLLNMLFINSMFMIMGLDMMYWARFAFYTSFAPMILMPKLIYQGFRKNRHFIIQVAMICYIVFFAYNIYVNVGYGALNSFYIDIF